MLIFEVMILSKRYFLRLLFSILFSCIIFANYAQDSDVEIVPIFTPEKKDYDWYSQKLPFLGATVQFPSEPNYAEKEIYTEKSLVTQQSYEWSNNEETLALAVIFYPLSESISSKNESKLIDGIAKRIAVIHGGYPKLSVGTTLSHGVREYTLEIKTIKSSVYKARVLAVDNKVLIVEALMNSKSQEIEDQAKYFLQSVSLAPLVGEISHQGVEPSSATKALQKTWDTLSLEHVYIAFPKYPVGQHKLLEKGDVQQKYYEWFMSDDHSQSTYVFSVIPLENTSESTALNLIESAVKSSLVVTEGKLVQKRTLDYFIYPTEEIIFKTKQQNFRVRYFFDGKYLYQLTVSSVHGDIYHPDANRFLDGLRWRE